MSAGGVWESGALDLEAYLRRIAYQGPLEPGATTLRELHRHHVASIPFENLDILLGRGIELDLPRLQAKLVRGRRGGYCFEHNLLFAAVLDRLGFSFTGLSARVTMGSPDPRPQSHMCLCVEAGGERWLADVGFGGDGLLEPVPMRAGIETSQGAGRWQYSLTAVEDRTWSLRSSRPAGWLELYTFTLEPRWPIDYQVLNWYTATNPHSPFTTRLIAQRVSEEVRSSLIDDELVRIRPPWAPEGHRVRSFDRPGVLARTFGIRLSQEEAEVLRRLAPHA